MDNNPISKIKPNIFDNQGGLPDTNRPEPLLSTDITGIFDANRDDPPYNQGSSYGFDPKNQYIGLHTPIDHIGFQGAKSPNPMDTNWGGIKYTQKTLELEGKIDSNKTTKHQPEDTLLTRVLNSD